MARLVIALLLAAALSGCASNSSEVKTVSPPSTSAAAASPARAKACQQFAAFFASLRDQAKNSGSGWTPEQGATELIATMQQSTAWATTSESERQDTIAGIKDAASGTNCG
ncbi:hypothetical protein GFY24_04595 [Nocardia sp. SYP-A9097]|uniref:hypothetical protein n=1 Tax=Nocardia sp. SYP-A9097 TaxID=2663237 RepID=UPI00129BBEE0|nr:hypothetical protein [Nocardia sp. SYP-A9097]MRH86755.1 hypothetical protein [Nocardia sp. SYP-A9097]